MSASYITKRLAPLASAKVQEAYGRGGTRDRYILAAELLEDAATCVRKVREDQTFASALDADARAKLLELGVILESEVSAPLDDEQWTALLKNDVWLSLRSCAQSVLAALHFDLAAWEDSEFQTSREP